MILSLLINKIESILLEQNLEAERIVGDLTISENFNIFFAQLVVQWFFNLYLLLTEFEGRTVSYGPSFFLFDLWPKREARGP